MKKAGVVILAVWAVFATALLIASIGAYTNNDMDWLVRYSVLESEYKKTPKEAVLFDSWAGRVSDKHYAYLIDDRMVVTVVYAEGRTLDEMTDVLKSHMVTFRSLIKKADGVLLVMNENDEVWFGYTFSDGEVASLVNTNYMD